MYGRQSTQDREIADLDVPAQGGHIGQDDLIADAAIVRHVRIGHQEIVVADARHAVAVHGAAVHRDAFTNDIAVADLEPGWLPLVLFVLGRVAQRGELEDLVVRTDSSGSVDDDVRSDPGARSDGDIRSDDAEGADLHVRGNFRLRRYHRPRVDHPASPAAGAGATFGPLVSGATMMSADATS